MNAPACAVVAQTGEVTDARLRGDLYRLFALLLDYPDEALHRAVVGGEVLAALERVLAQACPPLVARLDRGALTTAESLETLAADYSYLFEVGRSGRPPCPLSEGAYGDGDHLVVMEEVVRFYEHFGLHPNPARHEMPDQLGTELEFLHFLAYRQHALDAEGDDPAPYRHAELDFLERHPARWMPLLRAMLKEAESNRFYGQLVCLLDESLRHLAKAGNRSVAGKRHGICSPIPIAGMHAGPGTARAFRKMNQRPAETGSAVAPDR